MALKRFEKVLRIVADELDSDSAKDSVNARLFSTRIRIEFAGLRERVDQINLIRGFAARNSRSSEQESLFFDRIVDRLESLQVEGTELLDALMFGDPEQTFPQASKALRELQNTLNTISSEFTTATNQPPIPTL